MFRQPSRVPFLLLGLALLQPGCSQFTTSRAERSDLQAQANAAGQAYVDCVVAAAEPYLASGEDSRALAAAGRRECAARRDAAREAQDRLQKTNYILSDPQVEAALKRLDGKAEDAVRDKLLARRAVAPAPAPVAAAAATAAAAPATNQATTPATTQAPALAPAPADGDYLACMRGQGERYASVAEPAEVIAEVAHSRCAAGLAGKAGAADLERQGRALVMGMVLDRKLATPR